MSHPSFFSVAGTGPAAAPGATPQTSATATPGASPSQNPTHEIFPRPFNGRCKYKSGRCMNERTLKENGQPHTLCEDHRVLHNKNQRKSDTKRRRLRKGMAPFAPTMAQPTEYRSAGSTYSSDPEDARSNEELSDDDSNNATHNTTYDHTMLRPPLPGDLLHYPATAPTTPSASSDTPTVEWSTEEITMLHSLLGIRQA
ncbi:hypothetical protein LEN26_006122 [Aphanomyces euteiches]|nr:hypothetical protein LEN26_006122 [Aphanomyces euteiches]